MSFLENPFTLQEYQVYEYMTRPPKQSGCKNRCMHEHHLPMNQVWRIRKINPDKTILFCRQCNYCVMKSAKRCYCCGHPLGFAHARFSESRKINSEKKVRY